MGQSKTPGLYLRAEVWHIDKQIRGRRLCESTGTGDLQEAEAVLAKRILDIRHAAVYGVRPDRTFRQAAIQYLDETEKRSLARDAQSLKILDPYIGDLPLRLVHDGTLAAFVKARRSNGVKSTTINRDLAIVRRILNLAARKWRDENGLTWIEAPPLLGMLKVSDARKPYPLDWDEQRLLFSELAPHLQRMALFAVNTGLRDQDVCGLRWDWEVVVPELDTSVFIIPGEVHKNGEDRLVVLNRVARLIVAEQRSQHPELVFPYKGRRLTELLNNGWVMARKRAAARYLKELGKPCPDGFRKIRVHDLKHTFGRRLRAAGVSFEDRQDLLGHKSSRVTTHYSGAELANLITAAEKVCGEKSRKSPALVILKRA